MLAIRGNARALVRLAAWVAVPLALAVVPTRVVESGPTLCLYRNLFGVECPGCGMTRAFSHALHGEFRAAAKHNRLVVIVLPLAAGVWAVGVKREMDSLAIAHIGDRHDRRRGTQESAARRRREGG